MQLHVPLSNVNQTLSDDGGAMIKLRSCRLETSNRFLVLYRFIGAKAIINSLRINGLRCDSTLLRYVAPSTPTVADVRSLKLTTRKANSRASPKRSAGDTPWLEANYSNHLETQCGLHKSYLGFLSLAN
jgi:hypothetical protein